MAGRKCAEIKGNGGRCRSYAGHDSDRCFWHDPENAESAAEARRLGGQRTRRNAAVKESFSISGLRSIEDLFVFMEDALVDTLSGNISMEKSRVLLQFVKAANALQSYRDGIERLEAVERAVGLHVGGPRLHFVEEGEYNAGSQVHGS